MKKRMISLFLSLLLMAALVQLPALAAEVPRIVPGAGEVYVGETKVSVEPGTSFWIGDGQGGLTTVGATPQNFNVSYNGLERILTLQDARISTGINYAEEPLTRVASIYSSGDLTIVLRGSSVIDVPGAADFDGSVGITTEYGDLVLTGENSGRLTINAGAGEYSAAMTRVGTLFMENADVTANGGDNAATSLGCSAKELIMYDSRLTAVGGSLIMDRDETVAESYGLICGNIDLQLSSLQCYGGDVHSTGQEAGGLSVGMFLGTGEEDSADGVGGSQSLLCQGGDVNVPFGQGRSYGLWLNSGVDFSASDVSSLEAYAGPVSAPAEGSVSYGISGFGENTVEIFAGSLGLSGETLALSPDVTLVWRGAADQVNLADSKTATQYSGADLHSLMEQSLMNNLPDMSVTQLLTLAPVRPVIREIDLTLAEPTAGTLLSADAVGSGDDRFSVQVTWCDKDSGADVTGTRAQPGRTYEADITLLATQDVSGLPNVWLIPDRLENVSVNSRTVGENSTVRWFPNDGTMLQVKADCTVSADTYRPAFIDPFTDVPVDAWYASWVQGAYDKGLIAGMTPTTFEPDGSMTYAQAITLAARMCLIYNTGEAALENGTVNWYDPYVDFCLEHGIIDSAYEDRINDNIDRQTYVDIFSRALPEEAFAPRNTIPDGAVPDVPEGSEYYDSIYLFYRAGILNGSRADGTFDPNADIKRSEVAAVLNRMMDSAVRVDAPADLAMG